MKPFVPTEEEFELLLTSLDSYVKEQVTGFIAKQYLKRMEGLSNEQAFIEAFSKKPDGIDQGELQTQTKEMRDKVVLLAAKLVQMRNHFRDSHLNSAIEDLTK